MKVKLLKDKLGFSLVEILVTILLFSVLSGAIYSILLAGFESYDTNQVYVEVQQDLRFAFQRINLDLTKAGSISIIDVPADGNWYNQITFRVPSGVDANGKVTWPSETVAFELGGTGSNELRRVVEDGGSETANVVVAQNINTLQFKRESATPKIVDVNIITQKTNLSSRDLSSTLAFKVNLRN